MKRYTGSTSSCCSSPSSSSLMSEEPSSVVPDHDPCDDYVWEEQPGLGLVPVARRDSAAPVFSAPVSAAADSATEASAMSARFDDWMDEEDRRYDPLYMQAEQDRDDLFAQSLEQAPEFHVPLDLVGKVHSRRGAFDPNGDFKDIKLSDSAFADGYTVAKRTIKRFKNGDVETTEADGSKVLVRADGSIMKTSADGTVTEETPEEKEAREKEAARREKNKHQARKRGTWESTPEPDDGPWIRRVRDKDPAEVMRRIRGRMAGASLPSNRARRAAEASNAVREEHPDVLMFGGFNVLPDMQRELGQIARKGEMNMRPGSEKLLHDERVLEAPVYMKHFAGERLGADWQAEHPDDLLEQEDRDWRAERKRRREEERKDTRTETEKLVAQYKIRKNMDVTGEIMEEDAPLQLAKMRENELELEAIRVELARREEEARREEDALEKQLMDAVGEVAEPTEEPAEEPADGYDSDIENRVYPDAVPAYLLDRREYYMLKPKPSQQARKHPALGERSANCLGTSKPTYAWPRFGPVADEGLDSDSDCEIVEAPPDKADRMVEA